MTTQPRVVIITGMSGAGRSSAANVLEDIGYFVVDNLPPSLISAVVEHRDMADAPRSRLAVVVDSRGGLDFDQLETAIRNLLSQGVRTTVLFLDATDTALVTRFEETRRTHPVEARTLADSIAMERTALEELRGMADVIVDTTDTNVHELRDTLRNAFSDVQPRQMRVDIVSFGFKRGLPRVLDLLFDVRFLPNPHWDPQLRPQTGLDQPVREYVLHQDDAKPFMEQTSQMLEFLIPRYMAEGKAYLTIGIGCTGGRHRSVAIATALAEQLETKGLPVSVSHRDLEAQ
ncbi:MAG: RNase adapter RapZ [Acidimicrobiia bacterium]|nr:RNase adapter RapZ [Acidimicrobiia bacterium]